MYRTRQDLSLPHAKTTGLTTMFFSSSDNFSAIATQFSTASRRMES